MTEDTTADHTLTARGFPDDGSLRSALAGNAIFSALSGLVMVVGTGAVSGILGGAEGWWLRVLGTGLVAFGVVVGLLARRRPVGSIAAIAVTAADVVWVLGSFAGVARWHDELGGEGTLVVLGVAAAVAGFAILQLRGLARYARNRRGRTAARSRYDHVRAVPGSAPAVWDRLRRLDRIGDFYPDLTRVEVSEENGVIRRTCGIGEGSVWSEEVLVMDDEGRELVLEFDTTTGRFPMPVREMIGGWQVQPRSDGSAVHLWYEYTVRWGWAGEVVAALMTSKFNRQLGPVVERIGRDGPGEAAGSPAGVARRTSHQRMGDPGMEGT